jgi:ribosome-binding protein aMBF1 (putative translation factor)
MVLVPLSILVQYCHLPYLIQAMTKIEQYVIDRVREKRKEAGLSQIELSQKLNMSDSFVSHVETPNRRAKYNINHLNALAKVFKCSPKDFWPDKPI